MRCTQPIPSVPPVDLAAIDQRLQELLDYDHATQYSKQKDSLQRELKSFLAALPGSITLATGTPHAVCRFLIFKDPNGKSQVHRHGCKFLGQRESTPVAVHCDYRIKQWIHILANYGQFSMLKGAP